jgi:hypothetical protein
MSDQIESSRYTYHVRALAQGRLGEVAARLSPTVPQHA